VRENYWSHHRIPQPAIAHLLREERSKVMVMTVETH